MPTFELNAKPSHRLSQNKTLLFFTQKQPHLYNYSLCCTVKRGHLIPKEKILNSIQRSEETVLTQDLVFCPQCEEEFTDIHRYAVSSTTAITVVAEGNRTHL